MGSIIAFGIYIVNVVDLINIHYKKVFNFMYRHDSVLLGMGWSYQERDTVNFAEVILVVRTQRYSVLGLVFHDLKLFPYN